MRCRQERAAGEQVSPTAI